MKKRIGPSGFCSALIRFRFSSLATMSDFPTSPLNRTLTKEEIRETILIRKAYEIRFFIFISLPPSLMIPVGKSSRVSDREVD